SLPPDARSMFDRVISEAARMGDLVEDLLRLAQVSRRELQIRPVDLSATAARVWREVTAAESGRTVEFVVAPGLTAQADPGLLAAAFANLLSNAFKYTGKNGTTPRVEVGTVTQADGTRAFFVRDNGAGFDMAHAKRLFAPFQRLHTQAEFAGTGV